MTTRLQIVNQRKIIDKFLHENIEDAIFERYPLKIFNEEVKIHINKKLILPSDFVIGNHKENSSI